jgi:hypothetical protein
MKGGLLLSNRPKIKSRADPLQGHSLESPPGVACPGSALPPALNLLSILRGDSGRSTWRPHPFSIYIIADPCKNSIMVLSGAPDSTEMVWQMNAVITISSCLGLVSSRLPHIVSKTLYVAHGTHHF